MGYKQFISKVARYILFSQPQSIVNVEISQINYGSILKGKSIVITGGGRGLGYNMGKNVFLKVRKLLLRDVAPKNLEKAVEKLGKSCQYLVFDVGKTDSHFTFWEECRGKFGRSIDSLICNAGNHLKPFWEYSVTI